MEHNYKIFDIKTLLSEIQYGVRKGTKNEQYLEHVIKSINLSGKYVWVQFFQLVDIFYVVVEVVESKHLKNSIEESAEHYSYKSVDSESPKVKFPEEYEKPQELIKTSFPWKTKK